MSADDFLKVFAAAFCAALFTLTVTWLKAHRDDIRADANYFIDILMETANLASSYWLLDGSHVDVKLMEVRLRGLQQRLSLLRPTVFASFRKFDQDMLILDLQEFFDACTGGEHGVNNRASDRIRSAQAQEAAAQLDAKIRKGVGPAISIGGFIARKLPFLDW